MIFSAFTTETHLPAPPSVGTGAGRQGGRREKALRFFDLMGEISVRSKVSALARQTFFSGTGTNT